MRVGFVIIALIVAAPPVRAGSPRLAGPHSLHAPITQPTNAPAKDARVLTTGYCECGDCCGWHRSWFGLGPAVISSGPLRGKPKDVGITAARTRARPGVIAADTDLFAFGTILFVPGYGWGRVEDVGGGIKGYHLDLFFDSHEEARQWGVRKKVVRFWRPPGSQPKGVRVVPIATAPGAARQRGSYTRCAEGVEAPP